MTGVAWVQLVSHADARGCLVALDPKAGGLPFEIRRVFYLFNCGPEAVRAGHAQSADELLIAVRGAVTVECDNGRERSRLVLGTPDRALHVRAGVWIALSDFSRETIVLVASPASYDEVRYFKEPLGALEGRRPEAAAA